MLGPNPMANNLNLHKRPITSLIRISGALWCQSERIPKARKVVVTDQPNPCRQHQCSLSRKLASIGS